MSADVLPLPLLAEQLPPPPPRALDPLLDAAVDCLSRHGLSRTSLSDIARELGVAPSTVYRKVGSVEHVTLLILAREAQRFLERIPELLISTEGPRAITTVMAEGIRAAAEHPVASKVLRDEGDWMGRMVTRRLEAVIEQGVEVGEPLLAAAMDAGMIRRQDLTTLAHWLLRIALAALVAPPPGDLAVALDALLLPMLTPTDAPAAPAANRTRIR